MAATGRPFKPGRNRIRQRNQNTLSAGRSKRAYARLGALLLSLLVIWTHSGCGVISRDAVHALSRADEVFGTVVSVTLYDTKSEEALSQDMEDIFAVLRNYEKIFSATDPDSELSRVNASAYENPQPVSEELYALIGTGLSYGERTDGAFDIAIGGLVTAWGIGTEHPRVPEEDVLERYRGQKLYQKIVLDPRAGTVQFLDPRVSIDLGAIAKGYIADQLRLMIQEECGISSAMVSLGGNIWAIGYARGSGSGADKDAGGADWNIGIADPFAPSEILGSFSVTDASVVTSGVYERNFTEDGVTYHHILDPATACPGDSGLVSVTVLSESSMDADALSTSIFLLGKEAGLTLAKETGNAAVLLVESDGTITVSENFPEFRERSES